MQGSNGGTRSGPGGSRRARRDTETAKRPPREGAERQNRWGSPQDSRGGNRRQRHRLDLDIGTGLVSVDLQEDGANAQGRPLTMGNDDFDLLCVGHG